MMSACAIVLAYIMVLAHIVFACVVSVMVLARIMVLACATLLLLPCVIVFAVLWF